MNLDSDNPNIVVNFETNTLEDDEGMCHSPDSETENTSTYLRHLAEIRKHLEDKNLLSIIESYANREGCTDLEKTIISKIDDAFRREWLIYSHVRDEEVFVKPDNKEIGSLKAVITEEIYSELQELIDLFIEMDRTQLTPLPGLPISGYCNTINPRCIGEQYNFSRVHYLRKRFRNWR